MSKWEIKKMFFLPSGTPIPCGLNIREKLWWRFVPGETITVRWPSGWVVVEERPDGSQIAVESTDPNDHYRPELERLVGRQGRDWDWGLHSYDIRDDRLIIKIRKKYANLASYFAIKWA